MCPSGKDPFPSWRQAQAVAKRMLRRDRRAGRSHVRCAVYHCPDCGAFHVTSSPPSIRRGHWW